MNNIYPEFLKKGSKIAIISPSGSIKEEMILAAEKKLINTGYDVVLYPSCHKRFFQFGGTDKERLDDLQNALNDKSIDAILCSRGGYGMIRIIDKLDFTEFLKKPKWVVGFSDITNLHLAINKIGVMSIHGQMAKAIYENPDSKSVNDLLRTLKGEIFGYSINPCKLNNNGKAKAELIGGNLSIIYSLQGTEFEINTDGKILFIEDLNEYLYHLDRMMINLKLSGKLEKLKGLIAGAFTDIKDNPNPFGKSAYKIISEHISEYDYPVCFGFPAGHITENLPLILGAEYLLEVKDYEVILNPLI